MPFDPLLSFTPTRLFRRSCSIRSAAVGGVFQRSAAKPYRLAVPDDIAAVSTSSAIVFSPCPTCAFPNRMIEYAVRKRQTTAKGEFAL